MFFPVENKNVAFFLNYGQLTESVSMKINNRVFFICSAAEDVSHTFAITKIWISSVAYKNARLRANSSGD